MGDVTGVCCEQLSLPHTGPGHLGVRNLAVTFVASPALVKKSPFCFGYPMLKWVFEVGILFLKKL